MDKAQLNALRIDYEVLNATLGVEINVALPKETIVHVIRARFNEMSRDERAEIPEKVMGIIQVIIQTKETPVKKKKARFEFTAPDAILLKVTGKTNEEICRIVIGSNSWAEWSQKANAKIHSTEQGIVLESEQFKSANPEAIGVLLRSFGV